jgi:hypothetical protein
MLRWRTSDYDLKVGMERVTSRVGWWGTSSASEPDIANVNIFISYGRICASIRVA